MSEDPIGLRGGVNKYSYVLNSPVNFVDALGLEKHNRCPGRIQSGLLNALLNLATLGVARTEAELSGHVVTEGYDANLALTFGTLGLDVHAGSALAFGPHGTIAFISATGAGRSFSSIRDTVGR